MNNPQFPNREAVLERELRWQIDADSYCRTLEQARGDGTMDFVEAMLRSGGRVMSELRAIIALIPSPDQGEAEAALLALIGQSVVDLRNDDPENPNAAGFWRHCSGCIGTDNPHSEIFNCDVGMGCRECGGLGVLWDDADYAEMARYMLADDDPVVLITVESEHERATFTFVDRAQSEIFLADCRKRTAVTVTAIDERASTTAARAAEGLDEMLESDNAA